MEKLQTAVVGATGIAGQQFLESLENHPFLEVVTLAASKRSAGKAYVDAIRSESGAVQWFGQGPLADKYKPMVVQLADTLDPGSVDLVFSAIETAPAKELEPRWAAEVPVISTASAFRYDEDVPIFIPAVNNDHERLIEIQKRRRGWKGFVTPIPNCTTTGLAITLKPIHQAFGVETVIMTSMQAVSGAGRSPGVLSLDIVDNVVPYIPGEESKVAVETRKILGTFADGVIEPADIILTSICTRVPVLESHTEAVFVGLKEKATVEEATEAMRNFGKDFVALQLPSSPEQIIQVHDDPFRPQPRRDRDAGGGMTTSVGRLEQHDALPNGLKWALVSHNTKMGAAKGAILVAEYLRHCGHI